MKRNTGSQSFFFSQTEFAYILLFIALGALAILYLEYRQSQEEVAFLLDEMKKMEKTIIPCWKRPDGEIPKIVGTITIENYTQIHIERTEGGDKDIFITDDNPSVRRHLYKAAIEQLFSEDINYADCKVCYLRIQVINHTPEYSLFLEIAQLLRSLNIVVVNE